MAFTGSPTFAQVSDRKVRITGLSLAAGANGTIGLDGSTASPGVTLPAAFVPKPYVNAENVAISLIESVQVSLVPDTAVATAIPVEVVKSGATNKLFLATLTNNHGSIASPGLEIYVEWH